MKAIRFGVVACVLVSLACPAGVKEVREDYSWVRGVNYTPDARQREQTMRELGYGKRVNLNACRFWLGPWDWKKDPEGYTKWVRDSVRLAHACGYRSMPILFNGNGLDPNYLLEEKSWPELANYAKAIACALKNEPGLLMIDVMNEPECCDWVFSSAGNKEENAARRKRIQDFVRRACAHVKAVAPKAVITVGYTTSWEIQPTVDCVDVVSFHDYSGTLASIEANFANAAAIAKKAGKAVLQTETGCLARCNPYDLALGACERHHMGWFLFELVIRGRCDSEHGIFYPDGTVRDPATIAAMMGCYRNRDLATIIPGLPNREGAAERCVSDIKAALAEKTGDMFNYQAANVSKLLEACERAANLLECCDLVPMVIPPTAKIAAWRKMEKAPLAEIRAFAYDLALRLRESSQLL